MSSTHSFRPDAQGSQHGRSDGVRLGRTGVRDAGRAGNPLDGAGYLAGGVGIAGAGRDSGGSQWFVIHSRAPHLDGRHTWIGAVESGQTSADALLIGDRVVRAVI